MKIAIVRGSFANPYELQNFEGLVGKHEVTVFASKENRSYHLARGRGSRMTTEKLFCPYDWGNWGVWGIWGIWGKRYVRGILNRVFIDSHYLFGLENKLKGFDIAHCAETYYHYTQQCLNAKKKGFVKKVVCTVWENISFNNEGIWGRKSFKKRAFEEVDLFLAVTNQARKALILEGCDEKRIEVLGPGVDVEKFEPKKKKILSPRYAGLQDDDVTVLYVGRMVEEKGVFGLQEVCKKLNLNLRIASNVPYEEMPQVYKEADIFVLPSKETKTWTEQYGMVLLEAMASGLPIITTNTGAIPEIVGNAAIITNDLEKDLKRLVADKNLQKKLSILSRSRACEYFDSRNYAKKLEKLYKTILL